MESSDLTMVPRNELELSLDSDAMRDYHEPAAPSSAAGHRMFVTMITNDEYVLDQLFEESSADHRCERVFAPTLTGLRGARRTRRLAQLIAVTDVLTWKLLRHDRQLSRHQTELALIELLQPLTGGG